MHDPPRRGCPAPAPTRRRTHRRADARAGRRPPPAAGAPPPRPPAAALAAGLTPEQAAAVRHGRGPLLLVAGPGTGKTRTLTHRVAYLLASGRAAPRQILAVTFSVRAAGELRLRLARLLGEQTAPGGSAPTFPSLCARLLREHPGVFGRTGGYTNPRQGGPRHPG